MKSTKTTQPAAVNARTHRAPSPFRPRPFHAPQNSQPAGRPPLIIQPKLTVGPANDRYEQEAEQVAHQVVTTPAPIQRRVEKKAEDELQRNAFVQRTANAGFEVDGDFEHRLTALNGSGVPLPDALRADFEPKFGADFGQVRTHTDGPSDQLNQSIQARAFTAGSHIFFRKGEYNPGSSAGKALLAHELTHTVQQGAAHLQRQISRSAAEGDNSQQAPAISDTPVHLQAYPNAQGTLQRAKGDYKRLWTKDPRLAKLAITQKTGFANYISEAKIYEQALGAGLFVLPQAHQGADLLINAIGALIGEANVNAVFGSNPSPGEAGAIPAALVAKARQKGNLREKMYMVYAAIRSGAVARQLAVNQGIAIPTTVGPTGAVVEDLPTLTSQQIPRRMSTASQQRTANWDNLKPAEQMTTAELAQKGAPLSKREKQLAGGEKPQFYPGEKYYRLESDKKLKDTSLPKNNNEKTFAEYQQERLAPLAAGLSGSTDWYFNVAKQLGMAPAAKKLLRLAALGQMLVNRDHSYHEIMHEARTQGKLNDYPDELPIGYTTLDPLNEDQILAAAHAAQFPGDVEAANFNAADIQGQAPQGLAAVQGLPTATGLKHLAGEPTRRSRIFGGGIKSKKYLAVLNALDHYNTAPTAIAKKQHLKIVSTKSKEWLDKNTSLKKNSLQDQRVVVLKWLKEKADAMFQDKPGPPAPPWIAAEYFDTAASAEAAILQQIQATPGPLTDDVQKQLFQTALARVNDLTARQDLPGLLAFQNYLSREVNRSEDATSPDFVATTEDLSLDMNISIEAKNLPVPAAPLMARDWLQALEENVIENVKIIKEARRRGVGPYNNQDLAHAPQPQPNPLLAKMPANMRQKQEAKAQQEVESEVDRNYLRDIRDFQDNVDTSMLANVKPGPNTMDDFLKRLKGQPLPKELAAIAAYAEEGFYENMNEVLNHWHDKAFLATVPPQLMKLCRLAVSGLRKMKPYTGGNAYRGISGFAKGDIYNMLKHPKPARENTWRHHYAGINWTSKQFISTSKRWDSSYAAKQDKFVAIEIQDIKSGVDISAISNTLYEREVLFPPGAPLKVKTVEDKFVTLDGGNQIVPGTQANRLNIHYADSKEPGRIHITLGEE